MKPKVSIIMGVYNGSKYVSKAIESIINQDYENWEFIICDDYSSDDTLKILENYASQDCRIKIIKNSHNLGLAETLNNCIKVSKGEYIARQDDDDISNRNRLSKQIEFLDNNKDFSMVGSNASLINNKGDIWGIWRNKENPTKDDLVKGVQFIHPTIMIRREAILDVLGYDKSKIRVEDYDLWFRLYSKKHKGYNIQENLIEYRLDEESYKKRKYRYRINEAKVRFYGYRINNINILKRLYIFKPIILGLIPGKLMYKIHKRKFSQI